MPLTILLITIHELMKVSRDESSFYRSLHKYPANLRNIYSSWRKKKKNGKKEFASNKSRSSNHELPLCARIIQEYLRIWTNLNGNRIPCYYDLLRLPRVWSGVQGKQQNKAQIWAYRAIGLNLARSLCRDNNSAILSWNSIRYITG